MANMLVMPTLHLESARSSGSSLPIGKSHRISTYPATAPETLLEEAAGYTIYN